MLRKIATAWIAEAVLETMIAEADRMFPVETGGVLLGYWADPGYEVVITDIIGPGPEAVHEELSFRPDTSYQEQEIARLYTESGRHTTYLGDWHTHPRMGAYVSRRDSRTLRHIAADPEARAPIPLMAILAGGDPWTLKIWLRPTSRILQSLLPGRVMLLRVLRY